jgi:hypothetical protein
MNTFLAAATMRRRVTSRCSARRVETTEILYVSQY